MMIQLYSQLFLSFFWQMLFSIFSLNSCWKFTKAKGERENPFMVSFIICFLCFKKVFQAPGDAGQAKKSALVILNTVGGENVQFAKRQHYLLSRGQDTQENLTLDMLQQILLLNTKDDTVSTAKQKHKQERRQSTRTDDKRRKRKITFCWRKWIKLSPLLRDTSEARIRFPPRGNRRWAFRSGFAVHRNRSPRRKTDHCY